MVILTTSDGDRSTKVLFGDAASVSLIQKSPGDKGVFWCLNTQLRVKIIRNLSFQPEE